MAEKANKKPEPNMVELGSIVFILAVLFAVLLPAWEMVSHRAREQARLLQCQQNLQILKMGVETFRQTHQGRFPARLEDLVVEEVLDEMPKCPSSEKQSYTGKGYQYKPGDPGRYTIMCFGNAHGDADAGVNEPYYDSLYGIKPPLKGESVSSPSPSAASPVPD